MACPHHAFAIDGSSWLLELERRNAVHTTVPGFCGASPISATAVYLAMAAAAPPLAIVLVFLAGFAACVLWLWVESYLDRFRVLAGATSGGATNAEADSESHGCASCGRAIMVDPEVSRNALEGMHWQETDNVFAGFFVDWVLSNHATCEEVKAAFAKDQVRVVADTAGGWTKEETEGNVHVHFAVHDAAGKSLVIEFIDHEAKLTEWFRGSSINCHRRGSEREHRPGHRNGGRPGALEDRAAVSLRRVRRRGQQHRH